MSWKDRRRPLTVTALPETAARGAYGGTSSARDGSDLRLRRTNGHEAVVDVDGPARRRIFLSKMAEEEEEDGAAEPEPRIVTSPIVGDSYLKHSTELRAPKSVTVDFRDSPQGEKGGPGGPGGSGDGSGGAVGFPPLEESTLMFLHVFKCAGSTLRSVSFFRFFAPAAVYGRTVLLVGGARETAHLTCGDTRAKVRGRP